MSRGDFPHAPSGAAAAGEVSVTQVEREPLSRQRILDAALRLVDRDGLDALSMRRLGRELGVEAMSLYNHIPNKAALLRGMVQTLLAEIRPEVRPEDAWQTRLRAVMRATRATAHAHPHAYLLFARRPSSVPSGGQRGAEDLATLQSAGFSPEQASLALQTLVSFVSGAVLREIAMVIAEPDELESALTSPSGEGDRVLRDPTAPPQQVSADRDATFEFGLSVILDGLTNLLRQSASEPEAASVSESGSPSN